MSSLVVQCQGESKYGECVESERADDDRLEGGVGQKRRNSVLERVENSSKADQTEVDRPVRV